jgi:hypothetical protein
MSRIDDSLESPRRIARAEWSKEVVYALDVEPRGYGHVPNGCSVTAPRPPAGRPAKTRFDGIPQHIPNRADCILGCSNPSTAEAVFEQMSDPPVAGALSPRELAVQKLHSLGQPTVRNLDDEVIVRRHEAVREHTPFMSRRRSPQPLQEVGPVPKTEECGAIATARPHVVRTACEDICLARWSRHSATVRRRAEVVKSPKRPRRLESTR